jgi:hypothetical protein
LSATAQANSLATLGWDTWLVVGALWAGAFALAMWKIRDMRRERRQRRAAELVAWRYRLEREDRLREAQETWVKRTAWDDEDEGYEDEAPTVPIRRPYVEDGMETRVIAPIRKTTE